MAGDVVMSMEKRLPTMPYFALHKLVNGYVINVCGSDQEQYVATRLSQAMDLMLELVSKYEKIYGDAAVSE